MGGQVQHTGSGDIYRYARKLLFVASLRRIHAIETSRVVAARIVLGTCVLGVVYKLSYLLTYLLVSHHFWA